MSRMIIARTSALAAFAALALGSAPATGQSPMAQAALEQGLAAAFQGCALWVLDPASWASGPQPFMDALGLDNRLLLVTEVPEVNQPPEALRESNHYWRINATSGAGFVLVVSDVLPMCHITGGGNVDLQPIVETVLASEAFSAHWQELGAEDDGALVSTYYQHREEPFMTILVSRANGPRRGTDRVQVIATAFYDYEADHAE